jgi:hypothetical protein
MLNHDVDTMIATRRYSRVSATWVQANIQCSGGFEAAPESPVQYTTLSDRSTPTDTVMRTDPSQSLGGLVLALTRHSVSRGMQAVGYLDLYRRGCRVRI